SANPRDGGLAETIGSHLRLTPMWPCFPTSQLLVRGAGACLAIMGLFPFIGRSLQAEEAADPPSAMPMAAQPTYEAVPRIAMERIDHGPTPMEALPDWQI